MPPAALVSTTVRQPAAIAVRTPWTTVCGACPSYMCTRPRKTRTFRSPLTRYRTAGVWPSTVGGEGDLALGCADRVGGRHPAGSEHHGGVEMRHAGQFLQLGGAGFGLRERLGAHGADHLAVRLRLS